MRRSLATVIVFAVFVSACGSQAKTAQHRTVAPRTASAGGTSPTTATTVVPVTTTTPATTVPPATPSTRSLPPPTTQPRPAPTPTPTVPKPPPPLPVVPATTSTTSVSQAVQLWWSYYGHIVSTYASEASTVSQIYGTFISQLGAYYAMQLEVAAQALGGDQGKSAYPIPDAAMEANWESLRSAYAAASTAFYNGAAQYLLMNTSAANADLTQGLTDLQTGNVAGAALAGEAAAFGVTG